MHTLFLAIVVDRWKPMNIREFSSNGTKQFSEGVVRIFDRVFDAHLSSISDSFYAQSCFLYLLPLFWDVS